MRVLFVSPQRIGCGEAEFGRLWVLTELAWERLALQVKAVWEGLVARGGAR